MVEGVLSKSKIREGISKGVYGGWDDPRLGTLKTLRRRGFLPETIRQFIIELGPKPVDAKVSWGNLEALNRKLLDPSANRYFFVANPLDLVVDGVEKAYVSKQPLHPDYPERGIRSFKVSPRENVVSLHVSRNDLKVLEKGRIVRLMELFNIKVKGVKGKEVRASFHSEAYLDAKKLDAPLIHWLPHSTGIRTSVVMPDAGVVEGLAEDQCKALKEGEVVQFERFGFVRIDETDDGIVAYYAHR